MMIYWKDMGIADTRPQPGTIRVKIAVAITEEKYCGTCACGENYGDEEAMRDAIDRTAEGDVIACAFVQADIPLLPTVRGRNQ